MVIDIINNLLQISTPESLAINLGNLILLSKPLIKKGGFEENMNRAIVFKIYKCRFSINHNFRLPSITQGLILAIAIKINENAKEMISFLSSYSIDGRMALKVLIDKWLLHQPLFRGRITKNIT